MVVELLINGLVQGSLLALICIGYSLAYGTAQVINFAHADVMIAGGGYLVLLWMGREDTPATAPMGMALLFAAGVAISTYAWVAPRKNWGKWRLAAALSAGALAGILTFLLTGRLHFIAAALLAIPFTAALAAGVYRIAYEPLIRRNAPRTSVLLASLGFSIALESLLLVLWGSEQRTFPPDLLPAAFVAHAGDAHAGIWNTMLTQGILRLGADIAVPVHDVLIVVVFGLTAVGLTLFFRFSRLAAAIVATADSRMAARACGIPVTRILTLTFLVGGAIASAGGTLYVLRAKSLNPQAGFGPGVIAFVACVLGGIGSLRGSIVGAFLVSIVVSLAPAIPLDRWAARSLPAETLRWLPSLNLSDWSYGVIYAMMILAILFRPRGIFSR